MVIQEAFFHGRPMICSNIGGMAEKITNGVNGLHFRVGSAEDLADRLIDVLSDNKIWDRMREGIPRVTTYEECAEQHLAQYREVLKTRLLSAKAATEQNVASTA